MELPHPIIVTESFPLRSIAQFGNTPYHFVHVDMPLKPRYLYATWSAAANLVRVHAQCDDSPKPAWRRHCIMIVRLEAVHPKRIHPSPPKDMPFIGAVMTGAEIMFLFDAGPLYPMSVR